LIVAGTGVDAAVVGVLDFGDGIGELYEWSRSTYAVDVYSIKNMNKSEDSTMSPVKSPIFE
jgi:hypothetical protein